MRSADSLVLQSSQRDAPFARDPGALPATGKRDRQGGASAGAAIAAALASAIASRAKDSCWMLRAQIVVRAVRVRYAIVRQQVDEQEGRSARNEEVSSRRLVGEAEYPRRGD